MFHANMRGAIENARTLAQMDELSRQVWQALAAEAVTDDQAQQLAEALHARRNAVRETVKPVGIPLGRVTLFPPRRPQRAPDRIASLYRRRQLACSGPLPPVLASRFTAGQLAVLWIVGDEVAKNGTCGLCIDAIAARAGVCRRLAQVAVRLAEGDGLLTVQERRHQGRKNDPNVIRIISREWQAWLRRRPRSASPAAPLIPGSALASTGPGHTGCKSLRPTDRRLVSGRAEHTEPSLSCRESADSIDRVPTLRIRTSR